MAQKNKTPKNKYTPKIPHVLSTKQRLFRGIDMGREGGTASTFDAS